MSLPFSYGGGRLPGGSIRLLRILAATNEHSPIQCQVFDCALADSGSTRPYEALSYVWGSENKPRSIFIDGCDLPVGENLYVALSHLRDRSIERTIWIDAICINQQDPKEKGHQVQSMAKIYAKASRVIVWLGEAAASSDQALEEIRIAAATNPAISETNHQQAILTLLERPWFQRIWVLQEVAAARHVLIKCGPTEIDGYAFCSGLSALKLSYETCPNREGLIRSVAYLIRDAVFRPRYETSRSGRFSLDIRPLSELVDMYHTRKATDRRDKVYALLGMSSDDPSAAKLSADYETSSWEKVFQKLIKFSISDRMSVDTWPDKEVAVIKGKGCVLGVVSNVGRVIGRDDRQSVGITWRNAPNHSHTKGEHSPPWTFQASAKSIRIGDAVCLLQGASRPTIVRPCHDYSAVILIAAPLPDDRTTSIKWSELLRSIETFPNDFLLIWDWNVSEDKSQDGEGYQNFITNSEMGLQVYLEKATRLRDVGLLRHGMERYEDAAKSLGEAVKVCDTALRSVDNPELAPPGYGPWRQAMVDLLIKDKEGWAPLYLAAWNGNEAIVKLLLDTDKVDPDCKDKDGRAPLSYAAEKGHAEVVSVLIGKNCNVNVTERGGATPLARAIDSGSKVVLETLLKNGAKLNYMYQVSYVSDPDAIRAILYRMDN
ncbi:hypothetical protein FOPG_18083 [Fusarium oxysporum f. sp. conglutinans race 2 54008]|uniref:Heterokaryon incompatibility domain-containing protein n=2 Tax=Fusarium oxysporum TaxID=5507 RepID=X0GPY8_FUSOX|nr:hypothetical protein FOVG_17446 [Fusarium oxysporum f. sp. pisi HDV247]EXL65697.1 hypothetical protein FOPG_18083 [Fusarium oxysporum f. sp. conglutinans race 2 54008]